LAACASAGAPLTHRGAAQAVTFVTAHGAAGETPDLDWTALARANHTVVIYMGLTKAGEIAGHLAAAGRARSTPALIVENASRPNERRIATTLGRLASSAEGLTGPALLIIGEAMALAQPLLPHAFSSTVMAGRPSRPSMNTGLRVAAPGAARARSELNGSPGLTPGDDGRGSGVILPPLFAEGAPRAALNAWGAVAR
jgi:hypothetical protein